MGDLHSQSERLGTKPVIALDMDGVLCEEPQSWNIVRLNEAFGTSFSLDDVTDFRYSMMTHEHREFLFSKECWNHPELYDGYDIAYDKRLIIEELRALGRVIVVTSPLKGHIASKYRWLLRYFHRKDIFLASDKSLVMADILVDDCLDNANGFEGDFICYDQPWNRQYAGLRAHNFDEVLSITRALIQVHS